MLRYHEFDASEMSFASYVLSLEGEVEKSPLIAIPVFPSRLFRHSAIYVNVKSGINDPKDLIGKKVGTPEWQLTANVWVRGILADHYGVPLSSVIYYTGGEDAPGRKEKIPIPNLPDEVVLKEIGPKQTLSRMLDDGEIDALYTPRTPFCFASGSKNVRRLFPDFRLAEEKFYLNTGIFPIMHTVVLQRDLYDKNPWVARSLYKAFVQAQQVAYQNILESPKAGALKIMIPWLQSYAEEIVKLMGKDYWPYGIDPNQKVLDTFLRYCQEQGLSKNRLKPEELFAPETHEAYII
jgi:4,5-dihydroxyphthalate decarboxylase